MGSQKIDPCMKISALAKRRVTTHAKSGKNQIWLYDFCKSPVSNAGRAAKERIPTITLLFLRENLFCVTLTEFQWLFHTYPYITIRECVIVMCSVASVCVCLCVCVCVWHALTFESLDWQSLFLNANTSSEVRFVVYQGHRVTVKVTWAKTRLYPVRGWSSFDMKGNLVYTCIHWEVHDNSSDEVIQSSKQS